MTYHLGKETEDEFVASMRAALKVIEKMVNETGGTSYWNRNGTNAYIADTLQTRIQTAYYEALTFLGLGEEHEQLEKTDQTLLFNLPMTEIEDDWPITDLDPQTETHQQKGESK